MLETLRMSPSPYGLQPWKFVLVHDDATRSKLGEFDLAPAFDVMQNRPFLRRQPRIRLHGL